MLSGWLLSCCFVPKQCSAFSAFILSNPSLNLPSYPFGLPRPEGKFLTARLLNIKARPSFETVSIPLLNFSRCPARSSPEGHRSGAIPLKI